MEFTRRVGTDRTHSRPLSVAPLPVEISVLDAGMHVARGSNFSENEYRNRVGRYRQRCLSYREELWFWAWRTPGECYFAINFAAVARERKKLSGLLANGWKLTRLQ